MRVFILGKMASLKRLPTKGNVEGQGQKRVHSLGDDKS